MMYLYRLIFRKFTHIFNLLLITKCTQRLMSKTLAQFIPCERCTFVVFIMVTTTNEIIDLSFVVFASCTIFIAYPCSWKEIPIACYTTLFQMKVKGTSTSCIIKRTCHTLLFYKFKVIDEHIRVGLPCTFTRNLVYEVCECFSWSMKPPMFGVSILNAIGSITYRIIHLM